MKAISKLSIILLLAFFSGFTLYAQEKREVERERERAIEKKKEIERQEQIERQLEQIQEAMVTERVLEAEEIRKVIEDVKKSMEKSQIEAFSEQQLKAQEQALKHYNKSLEYWDHKWDDSIKPFNFVFPTPRFEAWDDESFSNYKGVNSFYNLSDATQLQISKNIVELDYSNDFTYDVPEGSSSISMSINGNLKDGELSISVIKPDGDLLQEITISPLADVSWSQTLKWKDEDMEDFTGTWKIEIDADEATGSYRVSLRNR